MGEVRRLLASSAEELDDTLAAMMVSDAAFGIVARAANTFSGMADRERGSVLSSARRHTAFLDDPRIVRTLARSNFSLRDLKHTPMTVYVVLPADKLRGGNARFVRGLVNDALAGVMADTVTPFHKVAFLLDEFAQLGCMTAIEDAISLVRGFGVSAVAVPSGHGPAENLPEEGQLPRQCHQPVLQRQRSGDGQIRLQTCSARRRSSSRPPTGARAAAPISAPAVTA